MKMVQVINGQIEKYELPQSGILKNGATVSCYNLLPIEVLKSEGWVELVEIKPTYNPETQYLEVDGYVISNDNATATYKISNIVIPPIIPTEIDLLKADLAEQKLQTQLLDLKLNIVSESMVI